MLEPIVLCLSVLLRSVRAWRELLAEVSQRSARLRIVAVSRRSRHVETIRIACELASGVDRNK